MLKKTMILFMMLFLVGCGSKNTLKPKTDSIVMSVGDEVVIEYTTNQDVVTIDVDDKTILSVVDHTVKALKVGETKVILKAGNLEATIDVKVYAEIIIDKLDVSLVAGQTHQINAIYDGELNYTSSDETVAKVSATGLVEALKPGNAVITVSLKGNEAVKKAVNITVLDATPEETMFEKAKANTESLSNYTIKVTIKEPTEEGANTSVAYYKFADHLFEFSNTNTNVFYKIENNKTYAYHKTLEGYEQSEVEGLPEGFTPFYMGLKATDFHYLNNAYFIEYGSESVLDDFKNSFQNATAIANIKLVLSTYYEQMTFNMTIGDVVYQFTFDFIDIDTTIVTIPAV